MRNKTTIGRPTVHNDKDGVGLILARDGFLISLTMADRENPRHPIFRSHNCAQCGSGARPCKQGAPNRCEFPHARND